MMLGSLVRGEPQRAMAVDTLRAPSDHALAHRYVGV
jgi:hypothetical protein